MNEILQREVAITLIKDTFTKNLSQNLNLVKISSPLIVLDGTGINDDLNGIERSVNFPVKFLDDKKAVVVNSLAKWKRVRLKELDIEAGKGIVTDMKALRPDEDYTPIHSVYVDQWDWEKKINYSDRNIFTLKQTVENIYNAIKLTEENLYKHYPLLKPILPNKIQFIHAEELMQLYPNKTPKERENAIAKKYGAVFIIGIGGVLSNGEPHDGRAPDYDDWSTKNEEGFYGLNGDILFWNNELNAAIEISSMGIRVDKHALENQLTIRNCEHKKTLLFHSMLISGYLPECIGGGIGQSRLCMFLLRKKHIGEVQSSVWSYTEKEQLKEQNIFLL